MSFIQLSEAKIHLRVDGTDEDALIGLYINAAEQAASKAMDRGVYADGTALQTAMTTAPAALTAATAAKEAAVTAAEALTDADEKAAALQAAENAYMGALVAYRQVFDGMSAADCIAQRDGWNTVAALDLSAIDRLEDAEASAEQCRGAIADELGLIPLGIRKDESYRDACYRWAAEWQAGADAIRAIEESAAYAEGCGADALAFAEAGYLEAAYSAAETACRVEREYGDCPVWGALSIAIRDEMENDADAE
jgi:hypothetical protein